VAPLAGRLTNRLGARPLTVLGLALQAAGMGWLALIATPSVPYGEMIAAMLIAGTGVSMAMPAAQTAVLNAVTPEQIGKASGVFNTGRQLGGVFGVAVLALVFSKAGSYAGPAAFTDGFTASIAVSGTLSLAGAVAALAIPGRRITPASAPAEPVLTPNR
jgi:MFS family permease